MSKKIALITGVTGQDGSYLTDYLLSKNYKVIGGRRRSSSIESSFRIDKFFLKSKNFLVKYLDLTDSSNINSVVNEFKPDEIYNLAAQSHVGVSFNQPEYTCNVNALGTLRILEAIRLQKLNSKTKFYQASSSEMFGDCKTKPQNENTRLDPESPYGVSKLFAYHIVKNYRKSFNIFASNGILFNHESPLRGDFFVTKKIIKGLVNIYLGKKECIYLGNLYSKRDWGPAKEYVKVMWKILQQKKPDDFVIGTGNQYTVKDFILMVGKKLGIEIKFKGTGLKEIGTDQNSRTIIKVDKKYFRPSDVTNLLADSSKAKKILKWNNSFEIGKLIDDMIAYELSNYK